MSNRVRETEQRRQDQVRKDRQNADANRAKAQAGQQSFQKQLKARDQKSEHKTETKQAPDAKHVPAQGATPSRTNRSALFAKGGLQAQHFQSVLDERGTENLTSTRKGMEERGIESEDASRTEQALLKELDRLEQEHPRIEGHATDKDGQSGNHAGQQQGQSNDGGQQSGSGPEGIGAVGGSTNATTSSREAALKAQAIKALVDQLFVGFQGAKSPTVMIELKGDLLRGTRVQLTMDNGKLELKFESPDPNLRRLLSASRGELERALEGKGLRLARLEVNERE